MRQGSEVSTQRFRTDSESFHYTHLAEAIDEVSDDEGCRELTREDLSHAFNASSCYSGVEKTS
eukprot:757936-Hanusia_phi.AAC.5